MIKYFSMILKYAEFTDKLENIGYQLFQIKQNTNINFKINHV